MKPIPSLNAIPWQSRWLSTLALAALGTAAAHAQTADAATTHLPYRSVFDAYQKLDDQPVAPWQQTNAIVEKIGGWRTYAKEARQLESPENTSTPSVPDPRSGTHHGHGGKP